MTLFYEPEGRLRLEHDGQCWIEVRPVWASPMSHPNQYLALVDGRDNEIIMFRDPETELSKENWELIQGELQRRYLNGFVREIYEAKVVFGYTYWTVMTDRGKKDFVTQSLQENAQWMSPTHLLLIDVDGNRYEIQDINALDKESKRKLDLTV